MFTPPSTRTDGTVEQVTVGIAQNADYGMETLCHEWTEWAWEEAIPMVNIPIHTPTGTRP